MESLPAKMISQQSLHVILDPLTHQLTILNTKFTLAICFLQIWTPSDPKLQVKAKLPIRHRPASLKGGSAKDLQQPFKEVGELLAELDDVALDSVPDSSPGMIAKGIHDLQAAGMRRH